MTTTSVDQAQVVYAAEDLWRSQEFLAQVRFGDWNEVWPFYHKLATACQGAGHDIQAPQVKARKGALKAHYDPVTRTVFIPPYSAGGTWALNTGIAIHEFAHHLSPGAGHGPEFRKAMLDCLTALGWDAALLEKCYAEVGLTASVKGDSITDKVGKLLTHADGASTEEERNTFISKAESLAVEHNLNLALIRKRQADADKSERDRPTTGTLFNLSALPSVTYRNLAVELGSSIARAHGAECTIRGKSQYLTFYGFSEDIHLTELMLTRLTPLMFEESDAYLKTPEHKLSGVASVSARITFCKAFARTVEMRLKDAVAETTKRVSESFTPTGPAQVTDTVSSESLELVLADKAVEVADYVAYEFKRLGVRGSWTGSRTSRWSGTASNAGAEAGRRANLYGRKSLEA